LWAKISNTYRFMSSSPLVLPDDADVAYMYIMQPTKPT
ncbi:hypothetical protein F442_08121, partial [Phytophthora nicotianae P10297]